jgi:hypothetical protein
MTDVRIHLSFDLDHDRDLHDRLLAQAKGHTSFAIASRSESGEMTHAWTERLRARITGVDEVVVICGEHTDESSRVSVELEIAREQKKPYVLLWGRRESMCKKPRNARADDGMYLWTPAMLEHQLASSLRRSREAAVPDGMKRRRPVGPSLAP